LRYGSVCSGIEAASCAWHPLGWSAAWLSEIERFPAKVLAHHYPDVPNLGDMRTISRRVLTGEVEAPDVLVGGTPCQAFSIAGLREGLADERGQLTISYVRLFDAIDYIRSRAGKRASVAVWENVPGVLSSKDNAFGCLLAGLAGEDVELVPPGKKWANAGCVYGPKRTVAWRVLDAQYFGVAQRRRRVFVIASARKDCDPAKILFEFDGVRRDSAPSREKESAVAALTANGVGTCGADDNEAQAGHIIASTGDVAHCLNAGGMGRQDYETETLVAQCVTGEITHTLKAEGFDASEDGTGRGQPIVPAYSICMASDPISALELAMPITQRNGDPGTISYGMGVRRLVPVECEALQAFPRGYTCIPGAADGPRYKSLGNSMCVNVMAFIGKRIQQEAA
jgi:DNA (cytosine-5)-methyltransferase 1